MADNLSLYRSVVERALSDSDFMSQLLSDPKGTLEAEGFEFPPEVTNVEIVQDTENTIHFVLPIPRGEEDPFFC